MKYIQYFLLVGLVCFFVTGNFAKDATEKKQYVKIPSYGVLNEENEHSRDILQDISDLIILINRLQYDEKTEKSQTQRLDADNLIKQYKRQLFQLLKKYNGSKINLKQVLEDSGFFADPNEGYWDMGKGELIVVNQYNPMLQTAEERAIKHILQIKVPKDTEYNSADFSKLLNKEEQKSFDQRCKECATLYRKYIQILQNRLSGTELLQDRESNDQFINQDLPEKWLVKQEVTDGIFWNCDRFLDMADFFDKVAELSGFKSMSPVKKALGLLFRKKII